MTLKEPAKALPNRQSIRKKEWDYSTPGWYFVTCNTQGRRAMFGTIVKGKMVLNEMGQMTQKCWVAIPSHFPAALVDEFVVMPNHVHGLVQLRAGDGERAGNCPPLGNIMGALKSAVSRNLGTGGQLPAPAKGASHIWHRNYWERIVRDAAALATIRRYIRKNPANYDAVLQCGEPKMLGNRALLEMPKVGFLASRGDAGGRTELPVRAGEAIISGFLSPMERRLFRAGLANKKPLIWVKPWGVRVGATAYPCATRAALDEGRLLILSPFDEKIEAPSARRAIWCNEYVLAHCERLVIGHLNPDGMLACLLSETPPDLPIIYMSA